MIKFGGFLWRVTVLKLICHEKTTLKEFTENHYAQGSFFWTQLLKSKDIKVNGKKVGENVHLNIGDEICYYLTKKQEEKPAFAIVYEDENILVADKESGVNSEAVFAALERERACYFLHRLDRNTKGLLVFALKEEAASAILSAFRERRVEKVYHALCFGTFPKDKDVLTAYLKKSDEKALVRIYDEPKAEAERIVTEYEVVEKIGEKSKVKVVLHTGKTHQIRAHLAHISCPIVGDMKYGDEAKNRALQITRQQLVSKSLCFLKIPELSYLERKVFLSGFELNI